jgi:hypothetical protein
LRHDAITPLRFAASADYAIDTPLLATPQYIDD